jgi:hypothetical protein
MNHMGETFALGHAGIGGAGAARTLVQRLVRFSPQAAPAVSPAALGRCKVPMPGELDLTALLPQPPQESEDIPAAPLAHRAATGTEAPVPHAAPPAPAPVQAAARALPSQASGNMLSAPSVAPSPADPFLPPQDRAAAGSEVFALDALASAGLPPAGMAHDSRQTPPVTPAAPPGPKHPIAAPASPLPHLAPPGLAAGEASPASAAAARPIPAPLLARAAPPAATQAWNVTARPAAPALPEALPPLPSRSTLAPAAAIQAPELEPLFQAAPAMRAMMATSLMGRPAAPPDVRRPVASAQPMGMVERLAEASRQRADAPAVRIGSVSVVMRPAPPPPPASAPAMPPMAAPAAATAPSVHRNPWLSRGRGGD